MFDAAARNLLAAWRGGDRTRIEAELDRAARACRLVRQYPAAAEERRELLEGIVEGLRSELAHPDPGAAGVLERLLAHLAAPPVSAHNPCHYLC
ncbi:MAG: hypothetical protein ACE15B_03920 [Bryobacteraceae bacterium]